MCQILEDRRDLLIKMAQASSVFCTLDPKDKQANVVAIRILNTIHNIQNDMFSKSQDQPGKISYAKYKVDFFNNQTRIHTTFGRYIRRQLHITTQEFPDHDLARWQEDLFGRIIDTKIYISIIQGHAITTAYEQGFGGSSCMTGSCAEYTELYEFNPDKVALVQYRNGINARALLWQTDQGPKVLDRIYPNSGVHVQAIKTWAQAQGYLTRQSNALRSGTVRLSDHNIYTVTVKQTDLLPYMDTFSYADVLPNGKLKLTNENYNQELTLQSTTGATLETEEVQYRCDNCGDTIHEDNIFTAECAVGIYCETCYCENFTFCEECEQDCWRNIIVQVDDNIYMCRDCANQLDCCDNCGPTKRSIYNVEETNEVYCEDCIQKNAAQCDSCSDWYSANKLEENENGENLCPYCQETEETPSQVA